MTTSTLTYLGALEDVTVDGGVGSQTLGGLNARESRKGHLADDASG